MRATCPTHTSRIRTLKQAYRLKATSMTSATPEGGKAMGSKASTGKPKKTKRLKWLTDRLVFAIFLAAAKAVEAMPSKICYSLGALCGSFFYVISFPLRKRTIRNLRHAGVAKTEEEAKRIAKETFTSFFKLTIDIFKAKSRMLPEKIDQILSISGSESSKQLFFPTDGSKPAQVIIVCAHFGNWEVAGQAYSIRSGIPLMSVMRPFDNQLVGDYILARRAGNHHMVCDKQGGVRALLRALKQGSSISILPDQHAGIKDGGIVAQFFGHPARTHSTPAQLHLRTGVPLLVLLCRRVNDDFQFEFIISEPIVHKPTGDNQADVLAVTQRMNNEIEAIIRRHPEQWLWAHRRWLDLDR